MTALWSAATAYFIMAPTYSLRVSNSRDLTALALYGAVGLVIARTTPRAKQEVRNEPEIRKTVPPPAGLVDLMIVLADLTSPSSELGERLRQRQIEIEASLLRSFRCSYVDAVRILSHIFAAVLAEPQLRRISFHAGRRPGVELLFVCAHWVWPPPLQETITIGQCDSDSSRAEFPGWPSYLTATWFDNRYGRTYQVSFGALNALSTRGNE